MLKVISEELGEKLVNLIIDVLWLIEVNGEEDAHLGVIWW